jgi:hypothetical protein
MQRQIMFDEKTLPDALKPVAKHVGAGRCGVPLDQVERLAPEELKNFVFLTKAEAKNVSIYRAVADRVGVDHMIIRD